MDTAPKDGTPILACVATYREHEPYSIGHHPFTVRWEVYHPNAPGRGLWRDKNGHKCMHLTHWMPVPEPPVSSGTP